MNRNYYFLTAIMFVLAFGTLFIYEKNVPPEISPGKLLWNVLQPTRFVTTDQVAKRLIEKDPSLLLIDVRPAAEYNKYSLPNAVNVPVDSLLTPSGQAYFGNPGTKVVLFSNDAILSNQAWVLLNRMAFKDDYVMRGGVNGWMETIIRPKSPPQTAPESAFERYEFRKAACQYFTGANAANTGRSSSKVKVVFKKRKKAAVAAGGC